MAIDKCFHVICEGPTDLEVFKAIIQALAKENGEKYKVIPLFPTPRHPDNGGWGNLKIWCLEQSNGLAGNNQRQKAAALGATPNTNFIQRSGDKIAAALAMTSGGGASFILIHMDTDIAEHVVKELGVGAIVDHPLSVQDRLHYCSLALDKWLGGHVAKKGSTIYYCLASLALENWIMTLYPPSKLRKTCKLSHVPAHYDHIHQPETHLIALGFTGDSDGRLRKKIGNYKLHGARIAQQLNVSRTRSFMLNRLCESITNA